MIQIIPKGFKKTEIGVIPEDWEVFTVQDLIDNNILDKPMDGNHGGIHPKGDDFVSEGVPFIMVSDLDSGKIIYNNCKFITDEQNNKLQKGFALPGDILLSHKATIGRTAIVGNEFPKGITLTPQVTYYRIINNNKLNNIFLYYYFNSSLFLNIFKQWAGGGSTRAYLGITAQKKLPILLPLLPQQQKIAQILSSLDDKIELLEKQNKTLENIGQAIFKSWFVDFEPFSGELVESEMGMIPRGWRVGKIGDLANIKSGFAFKSADFSKEGINIIKIKNITDSGVDLDNSDFVNEKGLVSRAYDFELEQGDILVAMSGNTTGKIAMMPKFDGRFLLNQRAGKFFMKNKKDTGFIYFYLKTNNIGSLILQTAYGSAQPNIAGKDIENFDIIIPSNKELEKYESISNDLIDKININIYQIKTLSIIRDSLLPRLMNGKIKA